MITVQFLPALIEVFKLVLMLGLGATVVLALVHINYEYWSRSFYLPVMAALGIALGSYLRVSFRADWSVVYFLGLTPPAVACFFRFALKGRFKSPIMFAAPAVVGVFLLFMYPLLFELYLAFHGLNLQSLGDWIRTGDLEFVGMRNFINVLQAGSETRESFWVITGRTFLWTFVNLFFHLTLGLALALILNQRIRFVGFYRTILILPWALPQLIAVLAWRGEFHSTYGYINHLLDILNNVFSMQIGDVLIEPLKWIGVERRAWWTEPNALFASICIVNIWLGVPFMMIVSLSALQGIPKSYYEAASLDGASKISQFFLITVPLLRPVMVPATILGMIWTFNNVNVVYLMTAQRGGSQGADILVSDLYKQAFFYNRYSFSAAYAVVIFLILLGLTAIWFRVSKIADDPGR
jgi:arabinogalactan oligomer/maltooligosaccharide transport system permease protein